MPSNKPIHFRFSQYELYLIEQIRIIRGLRSSVAVIRLALQEYADNHNITVNPDDKVEYSPNLLAKVQSNRKYKLADLLEGITPDSLQSEISTGYAVGNEIIDDDYSHQEG